MRYLFPFLLAVLLFVLLVRYTDILTDNDFVRWKPGQGIVQGRVGCLTPWGDRVASGSSVIAYANPLVGASRECESQVRTCSLSSQVGILS